MSKRLCSCDKTGIGRSFNRELDCHACWLWHHHLKYRLSHGGDINVIVVPNQPELRHNIPPITEIPNVVKQAFNFATAVTQHVFGGFKVVDEDTKRYRLALCQDCEFFNKTTTRCHKCGCQMNIKAAWAEQKCPIDKW